MCTYCVIGDFEFRHNPPWRRDDYPYLPPSVPVPLNPVVIPWALDKLKEYYELLKKVKEMEDKIGCPCEPNKADYLGLIEKRIAALVVERAKIIGKEAESKYAQDAQKPS